MSLRAAYYLDRTAHHINLGLDLAEARRLALEETYIEFQSPPRSMLDALNEQYQRDHDEDQEGTYR